MPILRRVGLRDSSRDVALSVVRNVKLPLPDGCLPDYELSRELLARKCGGTVIYTARQLPRNYAAVGVPSPSRSRSRYFSSICSKFVRPDSAHAHWSLCDAGTEKSRTATTDEGSAPIPPARFRTVAFRRYRVSASSEDHLINDDLRLLHHLRQESLRQFIRAVFQRRFSRDMFG
jgi:hypothetical protein